MTFEGQGGLASFFASPFPAGSSWADMDDDDTPEFAALPGAAPLRASLKRDPSHANLQLFNEGVFQVPILDPKAEGQPLDFFDAGADGSGLSGTPPADEQRGYGYHSSDSGGSDPNSFMPFSPSRFGVQARRASTNANVRVRDALLGEELPVEVSAATTCGDLKALVQSVQASQGARVIPAHFQVLSLDGAELDDSARVFEVLAGGRAGAATLAVEPRVPELMSFFLCSVCDLSRAPAGADEAEPPQFAMDPASSSSSSGGHEAHEASHSSPSSCTSPPPDMPLWPSPPLPLEPGHGSLGSTGSAGAPPSQPPSAWTLRKHDLARSLEQLTIKVSESKQDVSERVMALLSGQLTPSPLCGDASSASPSADDSGRRNSAAPWLGGSLDALLLGELSKEGEEHEGRYRSQSHLVVRGRGAALPHLPRFRLAALGELVRDVQDGLLQGNKPEEVGDPDGAYPDDEDEDEDCSDSCSGSGPAACASMRCASAANMCGVSAPVSEPLGMMALQGWGQQRASRARSEPDEHLSFAGGWPRGRSRSVSLADFDYGELVTGCCGGTYMMYNSRGEVAAVFKPIDEEPFAPSNPKGFAGRMDEESGMKRGIPVGGGAVRECAAFLLDGDGRAAVPATTMLRISHTTLLPDQAEVQIKVGSLQRFCPHECTAEDVGTAGFAAEQVHAIGVFDARTFNMDRNSDNLLVTCYGGRRSARALVPIDHGYILPSVLHLEEVQVCWLHWPQAHEPFSPGTLEAIAAIDAHAEAAMLRATLGLGEEALMSLFLGTALVQAGAKAGLTLHEIGMLSAPGPDGPSAVEGLVAAALADAPPTWASGGAAGVEAVQAALAAGVEALVGEALRWRAQARASCAFKSAAKGLLRSAKLLGAGAVDAEERFEPFAPAGLGAGGPYRA